MLTENQYPPQQPRPADFDRDGLEYRFCYNTTHSRQLWQTWAGGKFQDYAIRWPSGNFTGVPRQTWDLDAWLAENPKEPTA